MLYILATKTLFVELMSLQLICESKGKDIPLQAWTGYLGL
jgi:hypothetical protein